MDYSQISKQFSFNTGKEEQFNLVKLCLAEEKETPTL